MRRLALVIAALMMTAGMSSPAAARPSCARTRPGGGDWPLGTHDLRNSRRQDAEHLLGPDAARTLAPAWAFDVEQKTGTPNAPTRFDIASLQATPIVAGGCVFVATKQGDVEAVNADTGKLVWTRHVEVSPAPGTGGTFVGAPAYDHGVLYALVNQLETPYAIALKAATGALIWRSRPFVPASDYRHWYYTNATAVVSRGVLIAGFSPQEGDGKGHGGFSLIDASSGRILRTTYTIPRTDWAAACPDTSPEGPVDETVFSNTPFPPERECAGGGIWTTPAVDESTGYAYMGAGNPFNKKGAAHPRTNAILKVDVDRTRATFGRIVAFYSGNLDQGPDGAGETAFGASRPACYVVTDPYGIADAVLPPLPPPFNVFQQFNDSPSCGQLDLDFGAPQLLATTHGLLVGDLQKSGVYHLVDAATMGRRRVVRTTLAWGCELCNASTPAFDATTGRVVASVSESTVSFDPRTGDPAWTSPRTDTFIHYEPVSIANGVAYILNGDGSLMALDERDGTPLAVRNVGSDDGGSDAFVGSASSGIAIARHTVFVAAGHHVVAYRAS